MYTVACIDVPEALKHNVQAKPLLSVIYIYQRRNTAGVEPKYLWLVKCYLPKIALKHSDCKVKTLIIQLQVKVKCNLTKIALKFS